MIHTLSRRYQTKSNVTDGDSEETVVIQLEECVIKIDVMPLRVFMQANNRCKEQLMLNPTKMKFSGYGGSEVMVLGKFTIISKVKDNEIMAERAVDLRI